ncbi:EF-hand, partial [Backusella circina FSU 941]
TDAEIHHWKKTFENLTGGNGLTAASLKEIYRSAKVDVTDEEINAQQHDKDPEAGVTQVFEILDADKDGQISAEDLKRGVAYFGKSVTEQDIEEMMASADVDGDGLINFEEFLKIMTPSKVNGMPKF